MYQSSHLNLLRNYSYSKVTGAKFLIAKGCIVPQSNKAQPCKKWHTSLQYKAGFNIHLFIFIPNSLFRTGYFFEQRIISFKQLLGRGAVPQFPLLLKKTLLAWLVLVDWALSPATVIEVCIKGSEKSRKTPNFILK